MKTTTSNTNAVYEIRPLRQEDVFAVKQFADQSIGLDYYSISELEECYRRSGLAGVMCSYVLIEKVLPSNHLNLSDAQLAECVVGIRLSYPPGQWLKGKGEKLRPDLWGVPKASVAYFQSLFLSDHLQGQGWGQKLSMESIVALKSVGAKAIVTHSWKESPNNSSVKYLQKLGFKTVAVHPEYWKEVDYECTRDGKPCLCTAEEMLLDLRVLDLRVL